MISRTWKRSRARLSEDIELIRSCIKADSESFNFETSDTTLTAISPRHDASRRHLRMKTSTPSNFILVLNENESLDGAAMIVESDAVGDLRKRSELFDEGHIEWRTSTRAERAEI